MAQDKLLRMNPEFLKEDVFLSLDLGSVDWNLGVEIVRGQRIALHQIVSKGGVVPDVVARVNLPLKYTSTENSDRFARFDKEGYQLKEMLGSLTLPFREFSISNNQVHIVPYVEMDPDLEFSSTSILKHLSTLENSTDKREFLEALRLFIDICKANYFKNKTLPDIAGFGNVYLSKNKPILVDLNNIGKDNSPEKYKSGDKIEISLDSQGNPTFDRSIRLLYHIEKEVLSSKAYNKYFSRDVALKDFQFRPFQELKKDKFYGALRLIPRRHTVERLIKQRRYI